MVYFGPPRITWLNLENTHPPIWLPVFIQRDSLGGYCIPIQCSSVEIISSEYLLLLLLLLRPFYSPWTLSRTARVSQYQKDKTGKDLLEQEIASGGSGNRWAICKHALCHREITMSASHHSSFFTGQMTFLPPSQQCQSTEYLTKSI